MTTTWLKAGAAGIAVLAATFLAGRYSRAPQVVTRDVVKVQTVEVEKLKTVTVHDVAQAKSEEAKVRTVTVTKYRWLPGHVVEAEVVTTKQADTSARETREAHAGATQDVARDVRTTATETHTTEPARPAWSVSLMPGAQLAGAKAIPLYGPLVLGASAEHRFIGPVSIGAWASTSGAAGISIRGDL